MVLRVESVSRLDRQASGSASGQERAQALTLLKDGHDLVVTAPRRPTVALAMHHARRRMRL